MLTALADAKMGMPGSRPNHQIARSRHPLSRKQWLVRSQRGGCSGATICRSRESKLQAVLLRQWRIQNSQKRERERERDKEREREFLPSLFDPMQKVSKQQRISAIGNQISASLANIIISI